MTICGGKRRSAFNLLQGFRRFLGPDADARRAPGTLPIRRSLARMRSQARNAASSKSGRIDGKDLPARYVLA